MELRFLFDSVFCSNPSYAVTEWNCLNQPEQMALAGLLTGSVEIFGVFKPVDPASGLGAKLADKEVALLFYFLQKPGALPRYIKQAYNDEMNTILAKLVMEDVLQIQWNGAFVSGTNAFKTLYKEDTDERPPSKHIETISKNAIDYVLQLNHLDFASALARLYCYNTIPSFESLDQNRAEHTAHSDTDRNFEQKVSQQWTRHLPTESFKWLSFSRRNNQVMRSKNDVTYKIYVSPLPAHFDEVYKKTVETLAGTKAFSFKTAMDQRGILRPDRFVVYFHTFSDLEAAASLLKNALKGYLAQGVPFTAQLDEAGVLSWGIDPPENDVVDGMEGGSWRALVAEKLAIAVLQANAAQLSKNDAYDYIMKKIYLENINPVTWAPK